jgi:hypothetical protein
MKFLTVTGDSFSYKIQTMFPIEVLNVAYVPGSRAGATGAAGLGATAAGGVCASNAVDAASANKAFLIIKSHFATSGRVGTKYTEVKCADSEPLSYSFSSLASVLQFSPSASS